MMRTTFANALARATSAVVLVVPFVIFGLLEVLAVQPARAAAQAAWEEAAARRGELDRSRAFIRRSVPGATEAAAKHEFETRTPEENRAADVAEAIAQLANSPAVGGVAKLSIETGVADRAPVDPRLRLFQQAVGYTPITVIFDAAYAQIGRFFWSLRTLPSTFELRSVEIEPVEAPLMHARLVLFVFQRVAPQTTTPSPRPTLQKVDLSSTPDWPRNPFAEEAGPAKVAAIESPRVPDPVVHSILFSAQRQVALVDGRIVKVGDRLGSALVRTIEPDAVVLVTAEGLSKRLALERPVVRTMPR